MRRRLKEDLIGLDICVHSRFLAGYLTYIVSGCFYARSNAIVQIAQGSRELYQEVEHVYLVPFPSVSVHASFNAFQITQIAELELRGPICRGAVGVEEGANVFVPVIRTSRSQCSRPRQGGDLISSSLATASFESWQWRVTKNSTAEIADSRLQLADSVPRTKRTGLDQIYCGDEGHLFQ